MQLKNIIGKASLAAATVALAIATSPFSIAAIHFARR